MAKSGNVVPTITKAEHIGPEDTGDNIEAKRVALYGADPDLNWQRLKVTAGGALKTDATFTGSVTTAPTFALNPTAPTPTPAYGLIDADGDVQVDVLSSALPTGAATSLKQDTGNTSLASIDGKDFATQTTLALIKAKTDNLDVLLSTRTKPADAQHVIVDSGVTTGLTDTQLRATPVPVTANAGTNLNTSALALDATLTNASQKTQLVDPGGTNLLSIDSTGAIPVQSGGSTGSAVPTRAIQVGGSDGTNLRAIKVSTTGVVSVDGSAVTQPVSGTVTATPTGTQDINQKQVNGATINVGAGAASTGTQRVTTSTDSTIATITNVVHVDDNGSSLTVDGTVAATQSGTWNVTNVSGTVSLPTGASTSTLQTTGNSSLSSIDSKLSGTLTTDEAPLTTVTAFVTTVTTAGTRVQLASNATDGGVLQAPSTNTGIIYVGTSTVSSSSYGAELQAGQAVGLAIDNTNKIYIDSSVNGDKMAFLGSS